MMKRFPVIASILIVVAFLLIVSCASTKAPEGYGRKLSVSLASNPTTGYQWAVETEGAGYEKEDIHYDAPSTSRVGAGGTWNGTFSAFKEGTTTLTLSYKRSWDENSTIEQRIYTVTADKDGNILSIEENTINF